MPEQTIPIRPTILYRAGQGKLEAATVDKGDGRTMIVFRSEEEAEKFRGATSLYPESEGFRAVGVDHEQLAAFLRVHECTHVGMPEPWGEGGGVDRFEAADFIGLLEESPPA